MLVLSLDTASLVSSVALVTNNNLIGEITIKTKKTHSEKLMPNIVELMEKTGKVKTELTAIAVSIGPGSFTGLRVGLATAKTLAFALKIKIIGVSTLAALAYGCPNSDFILAPIFDAQNENVYYAYYQWKDREMQEIMSPKVDNIDIVINQLQCLLSPVLILGEAVEKYYNKIVALKSNIFIAQAHIAMPRAANVGMLGIKLLEQGVINNPKDLEPLYIKKSEAEKLWNKMRNKKI